MRLQTLPERPGASLELPPPGLCQGEEEEQALDWSQGGFSVGAGQSFTPAVAVEAVLVLQGGVAAHAGERGGQVEAALETAGIGLSRPAGNS